jgi:hypothetical protein
MLLDNQVVRFVRIPDHILRFVIRGSGQLDDLVTTPPHGRLIVVGIGHRLTYIEMMWPDRENSALEVIT